MLTNSFNCFLNSHQVLHVGVTQNQKTKALINISETHIRYVNLFSCSFWSLNYVVSVNSSTSEYKRISLSCHVNSWYIHV